MKTYTQLFEDIEERRALLRKRQLEQMQKRKEQVQRYRENQLEKQRKAIEREEIKQEIRKEMESE